MIGAVLLDLSKAFDCIPHDPIVAKFNAYGLDKEALSLTLFFPIFPFDPPEIIRKPLVFLYFQGDQKGTLGRKGLIYPYLNSRKHLFILTTSIVVT